MTHRCRTQGAQHAPPYARDTVFWRFLRFLYCLGRKCLICGEQRRETKGSGEEQAGRKDHGGCERTRQPSIKLNRHHHFHVSNSAPLLPVRQLATTSPFGVGTTTHRCDKLRREADEGETQRTMATFFYFPKLNGRMGCPYADNKGDARLSRQHRKFRSRLHDGSKQVRKKLAGTTRALYARITLQELQEYNISDKNDRAERRLPPRHTQTHKPTPFSALLVRPGLATP